MYYNNNQRFHTKDQDSTAPLLDMLAFGLMNAHGLTWMDAGFQVAIPWNPCTGSNGLKIKGLACIKFQWKSEGNKAVEIRKSVCIYYKKDVCVCVLLENVCVSFIRKHACLYLLENACVSIIYTMHCTRNYLYCMFKKCY